MKATGKCPKCSGTTIYTDAGITKRGERSSIGISSWTKLFIDVYICSDCGFTEEYICDEDLHSSKKRDKLASEWKKHTI